MVLDAENKLNLPEPDEANCVPVDEAIRRDIDVLWFYGKKELA
jgi:hypothetical protein